MNIFYLSTACSEEIFDKISTKCKIYKPTIAGIRFDKNNLIALSKSCDVNAISYLPIPSYPYYKDIIFKGKYDILSGFKIKYLTIFNFKLIKQILFIFNVFREIINWWIKYKKEEKIIIISSPIDIFLIPTILFKFIIKIKVICIVPDLQDYILEYRKDIPKLKKILNQISININKKIIKKIDGYILVSKYMNERLNKKNNPYIIIEGMIEKELINMNKYNKNLNEFIIMYAGSINEKYGIKILLEIFTQITNKKIKLYLFGSGDYESELKKICNINKNIRFFGDISHKEIIEYERKVNLLINTRLSNQEFTKYSFPSKIIEYMASGTPILTTKLKCFPKEYEKHLIFFEKEDKNSMKNKLIEVINMDSYELECLGQSAKEFILKEKTVEKQGEKIIEFLNDLNEK